MNKSMQTANTNQLPTGAIRRNNFIEVTEGGQGYCSCCNTSAEVKQVMIGQFVCRLCADCSERLKEGL